MVVLQTIHFFNPDYPLCLGSYTQHATEYTKCMPKPKNLWLNTDSAPITNLAFVAHMLYKNWIVMSIHTWHHWQPCIVWRAQLSLKRWVWSIQDTIKNRKCRPETYSWTAQCCQHCAQQPVAVPLYTITTLQARQKMINRINFLRLHTEHVKHTHWTDNGNKRNHCRNMNMQHVLPHKTHLKLFVGSEPTPFTILTVFILSIVIKFLIYKTNIFTSNIHKNTVLCLLRVSWNSAIFRASTHQYLKLTV